MGKRKKEKEKKLYIKLLFFWKNIKIKNIFVKKNLESDRALVISDKHDSDLIYKKWILDWICLK
jgi:hypothetical protein